MCDNVIMVVHIVVVVVVSLTKLFSLTSNSVVSSIEQQVWNQIGFAAFQNVIQIGHLDTAVITTKPFIQTNMVNFSNVMSFLCFSPAVTDDCANSKY